MSFNTIKSRQDFLNVQKSSIKWISNHLIVQVLDNEHKSVRFGLTVSRKTAANAVDRNKIKRRLREIIRKIMKNDDFPADYFEHKDIVIVARPKACNAVFQEIEKDLLWSLNMIQKKWP